MIVIGHSEGKGRGIFACAPIAAGALIAEAPVVIVPAGEVAHLDRTSLADYYFEWGMDGKAAVLVLGACQLCNHAQDPNAVFVRNYEHLAIAFFARRDIAPGEEITIHYHGDPDSLEPVIFPERSQEKVRADPRL